MADGDVAMVFSLFSQREGGTALWSETNQVRVSSGLFATLLGEKNPLPNKAFANSTWMEVRVNETTLSPRTELVAAPYALRTKVAEAVAEGAITGSMLGAGSVSGPALASNAVETIHLADQSVTAAKLAPASVDFSKIPSGGILFSNLASNAVAQIVERARGQGVLSVRDYGATGDGKNDDTAAFRSALTAAQRGPAGSVVLVPPGEYRLTSTLTVQNTLLSGLSAGGWPADTGPLPRLKVDFTNGPCFTARAGASIHGLTFEYDHVGQAARRFGPTVRLAGIGISLTNLRLNEPYEGIVADGTSNIGRLNVENVFIINARQTGVYVTRTADVATLRNIEVWNYIDFSLGNCTAFKFAANDEIRLSNCFAHGAKIAYHFVEGSTWGAMQNCSSDFCQWGILVDDSNMLRIQGGTQAAHWNALIIKGRGDVVVSGADLRSNGHNNVQVLDCNSLTLTGCFLKKNGYDWQNVHMLNLTKGKSVLVSACTFDDTARGIVIQPTLNYFSITGNLFHASTNVAITDNSLASAKKVIANNLMQQ